MKRSSLSDRRSFLTAKQNPCRELLMFAERPRARKTFPKSLLSETGFSQATRSLLRRLAQSFSIRVATALMTIFFFSNATFARRFGGWDFLFVNIQESLDLVSGSIDATPVMP